MKYTIEGFSQATAIEIGMDAKDLILLRWLVDFYNTGLMEAHVYNDQHWFWISYTCIARELPILGIESTRVMARRMKHLAKDCGVLSLKCFEGTGSRTYFRFNEKVLFSLLSDTERQATLFNGRRTQLVGGCTEKYRGGVPKSTGGVYRKVHPDDSSIIDSSIKDSIQPPSASPVDKPVENSKSDHSKQFTRKAQEAKKRGFNIYQLVNRFYKTSKLRENLPEEVLESVLDEFMSNGKNLNGDPWPYFMRVLEEESRRHFAGECQAEAKALRGQPSRLGEILVKIGQQAMNNQEVRR